MKKENEVWTKMLGTLFTHYNLPEINEKWTLFGGQNLQRRHFIFI